ncbi:AAA family ATPase, partial [Rhodobacterales bacterium HKCCSP123]|nr:AAA family ATPase [Rhodobacterales bacterium HKCCSP123]
MLRHLDIRDMLIIDRLELAFQPGLNVLTGETGAGKSILLDSLGFVLGWRGRADLVRAGAEQGEVVAEFALSPGHPARALLEEAGLPAGDELILRRVNTPEGRKTAWVNDRRASGEVLRALSDTLVELHGQQDDRGLLDPRQHRAMLDAFGGHDALLAETRAAWSARRAAQKALEAAEARVAEMRAEEDYLRHAVAELDRLDPQPGEEEGLDARRRLMQAAERMRSDVARAAAALGLEGAEGAMGDARRWLEGVSDKAEGGLDAALAALERAAVELTEAQAGVERFAEALEFNPAELEETEERLFSLRALARKHGVAPDDLAGLAEGLRAKLAALDGGAGEIADLSRAADAADRAFADAAARLG